jgi:hypothetical protein
MVNSGVRQALFLAWTIIQGTILRITVPEYNTFLLSPDTDPKSLF